MSDIRGKIKAALAGRSNNDLIEAAKDLLAVLGYRSDRTLVLDGGVDSFIDEFPALVRRPHINTESAGSVRLGNDR